MALILSLTLQAALTVVLEVRGEIDRAVKSAIYCRYGSKALTGAGGMLRNCRELAMNQHTKVLNKLCC